MALVAMGSMTWGCASDDKPPPAPSFTLRVPSEPTLRFSLQDRTPLVIEVTREVPFVGAIALTLQGLPAHIKVETSPVFVTETEKTGTFHLRVEELAPYGRFPIRVVGESGAGRFTLDVMVEVQPGPAAVDVSFGTEGLVLPALGLPSVSIRDMAVQPDGKWILVGSTGAAGSRDVLVARLLPDGTPDASFGTQGTRVIDVCGGDDALEAATLLPDGRLVLAGSAVADTNGCTALKRQSLLLVRLTATGALDPTFGNAGVWTFQHTMGTSWLSSVAVDSQGRFVGAGTVKGTDSDQLMVRLLPTGQLDPSFGTDGQVLENYGRGDTARVVLVLADDALLLGGTTYEHAEGMTLRRYRANGERDVTFNFVPPASATASRGPRKLYPVAGGKVLVVAGTASGEHGTSYGVTLSQFDATGAVDASFGVQGSQGASTPPGYGRDMLAGSGVLPGGEIAVATLDPSKVGGSEIGLVHISANGTKLRSHRPDLSGAQQPMAAVVDAEGFFRVAGLHTAPGATEAVPFVTRFWPY
ncbi:hypothetical protein MYSTI_02399 [Myxococcus stipitatus DSM 14675]|uniref:Delta-60 repeat domain-containing protein n=1 Tax=Myxococcus stipitatus (strain DSM 14675 / JCM 12634 / Mx s8) TaxID=1278073 RepID=L7U790_MYXSD|nr:delta-60 repeat domain-containing protein [Myxococcus stipitatus]AGC43715.1 hypothetical protein MYSTI_02399 [Myxococcus stipitatus DSM 14675]